MVVYCITCSCRGTKGWSALIWSLLWTSGSSYVLAPACLQSMLLRLLLGVLG